VSVRLTRGPFAYGDFGRRGRLDVVVGDTRQGRVHVYLERRDGGHAPAGLYLVDSPSSIVAADLDGDGFLDLAIASEPAGSVTVLNGLGDGRFRFLARYPVERAHHVNAVINARGGVDLVVGSPENPVVLSGNGDGTFNRLDRTRSAHKKQDTSLTARERQVAQLAALGYRAGEIAARLTIGIRTVETHLEHVRGKLGVRSKADLVRVAALRIAFSVLSTDDRQSLDT